MSKLTLIEGTNVVPLRTADAELGALLDEVAAKPDPTNRDLIVFAHRFVGLGKPIQAQKQLTGLSSGYFDIMIYKDLFSALYTRVELSLVPVTHTAVPAKDDFFCIVQSALSSFEMLNFPEKPAFYRFRHDFHRLTGSIRRS